MGQLSLFDESIDTFLVKHFSADGLCQEEARKKLELA